MSSTSSYNHKIAVLNFREQRCSLHLYTAKNTEHWQTNHENLQLNFAEKLLRVSLLLGKSYLKKKEHSHAYFQKLNKDQ